MIKEKNKGEKNIHDSGPEIPSEEVALKLRPKFKYKSVSWIEVVGGWEGRIEERGKSIARCSKIWKNWNTWGINKGRSSGWCTVSEGKMLRHKVRKIIWGLEDHSEEFGYYSTCNGKSFDGFKREILVIHSIHIYWMPTMYKEIF